MHNKSVAHHFVPLIVNMRYKFNSLNFESEKISVTTPWDHLNIEKAISPQ